MAMGNIFKVFGRAVDDTALDDAAVNETVMVEAAGRNVDDEAGWRRLTEALSSGSFSDVLGDSIARRMQAEYRLPDVLDAWRELFDAVPVADFRTQERGRIGGYGNMPIVAESAAYGALSSPGDEKATYAIKKRGGTETITIEMIANDDVGAIRRIPSNMSRSAKRTLYEFAFDPFKR